MSLPPLSVNLRALRKARGLRQCELAESSGVRQGTVSAIERGYRSGPARAVEAMAAALGVTVDALRSAVSCGNCGGKPPRGFTCQQCGTPGESPAKDVAA